MARVSIMFALVILGFSLLAGVGETQDPKKDKAKGQLPQGWKNLNLSPTQLEQVYTIQKNYKLKSADLVKALNDLKTAEKSEMIKVLTEEQKAKLIEITTGEKKDTKAPDKKEADKK